MARWLGWLLCLCAACACAASRYSHTLLMVGDGDIGGEGYLSNAGQAFYLAGVNHSYALFRDTQRVTDWATSADYPLPRGINSRGDLLWERKTWDAYHQIYATHVMLNGYNFSDNTGGYSWITARAVGLNESGQVGWMGTIQYGSDFPHASFVDARNYNAMYDVYTSAPWDINSSGQLLWEYMDAQGRPGLFVDGREAASGIGNLFDIGAAVLNDTGDVAWTGAQAGQTWQHAYLDMTDLTLKYLGKDIDSGVHTVNNAGQVLWSYGEYSSGSAHGHVMRDGEDLSVQVLGTPGPYVGAIGMNSHGDVLWKSGYGFNAEALKLYVSTYDLAADLLGSQQYDGVTGMDINDAGQVLWSVTRNGQSYYYLSTPVPEPSVLLLGLPLVAIFCRRRAGKTPHGRP